MRKVWGLAVAALASAGTLASAAPIPLPSMMFTTIEVSDLPRAEAFYVNALGMKKIARISKATDPYVKDALGFSDDPSMPGSMLLLTSHREPKPGENRAVGVMLGVRVADARAAADQVRKAGYTVLREPPVGAAGPQIIALVQDPDGNRIELVQLNPQH